MDAQPVKPKKDDSAEKPKAAEPSAKKTEVKAEAKPAPEAKLETKKPVAKTAPAAESEERPASAPTAQQADHTAKNEPAAQKKTEEDSAPAPAAAVKTESEPSPAAKTRTIDMTQVKAQSASSPKSAQAAPAFVASASKSTAPQKAWDSAKSSWITYYGTHRNAVVYGSSGGIVGVCILLFGFWPVLLIVVSSGIGIAYGQYRDGDPRIVSFFQRHFG